MRSPGSDLREPPDDTNWIERDGFMFAYDKLFAKTYNPDTEDSFYVAREAPDVLRRMFFPTLSEEGKLKIYRHTDDSFVRSQLKHYGVDYEESEINRKGAVLMRKAIAAGKFQEVPAHLQEFERGMLYEYIQTCQPRQLSNKPDWVMQRYWLNAAGEVDYEKTKRVARALMSGAEQTPKGPNYVSLMSSTIDSIPGLHRATVFVTGGDHYNCYYFMGWDAEAVAKSAARYYTREEAFKEFGNMYSLDKKFMADYPRLPTNLPNPANEAELILKKRSPIGHYIVSSPQIEKGWPETAGKLNLDVLATEVDGLYEMRLDFGRACGAMIFGMDKEDLECYCDELDYNTYNPAAPVDGMEGNTVNPDPGVGTGADSDVYQMDFTHEVHEHGKKLAAKLAADNDVFEDSPEKGAGRSQRIIFPARIKWEEASRDSRTLLGTGVRDGDWPKASILEFKNKRFMQFKVSTHFPFMARKVVPGPWGFLVFKARKTSFIPSQDKDSWESFLQGYQELGPYRTGCFPQRRVIPVPADSRRWYPPSKLPALIESHLFRAPSDDADNDADNDDRPNSGDSVAGAT
ncbi:hypothetical protein GGR57DRAFT_511473 [Xylariaceae sp. FL1272]|nr:hypothetical protein GGR57DRAFT_511473 [Xylariaceae sp. FL1272]